ncbi:MULTISPECIES: Gfo/Idh/MocA family protein [unclassified Streptomyces]|uniref:Gfo/Idh/MocA family protein n=1 Tax=unclassified Streptomyces TaxID=2593676 RepID=UPI002E2ACA49|nr:Gfo/Idh/MocA family oxidoreductase [Streptomyces sp. NBC_01439]
MRTVLVGYGHAARDLHRTAIEESDLRYAVDEIVAVDPRSPQAHDLPVYATLQDLPGITASDVFHVTVPPADHAAVVEEIVELGGKRIIVEKPLTTDGNTARRMAKACAGAGASLYPVGIWNFSSGVDRLRRDLDRGGKPLHYEFEQSKDRVGRTLSNTSHSSAFEVELPHQVLAAIWTFGEIEDVLQASSRSLWADGRELPHAGGAYVVVRHRSGVMGTLVGHLDKELRTRRLRVACSGGDLRVDLPLTKADRSSFYHDSTGRIHEIPDRPLTECLVSAYTAGPAEGQARFNVDMHVHCIDVLEAARRRAGAP